MRVSKDKIEHRRWFTTRIGPEEEPTEIHVHPCFGRRHTLTSTDCWCHPERAPHEQRIVVHNVSH